MRGNYLAGPTLIGRNGPQVGLLSLQAESYAGAAPYPLDVLDAGTQGMIGYLIQQELRSLLPPEHQVATLLTMVAVDPADPAFARPTKFVGPVYDKDAADALAAKKGWAFRPDGSAWRRVVPSPEPEQILEIQPISWLLERGAVVICAGGGGIPTDAPVARVPVPWSASKRSSTRTWPANCWPRTWVRTCSSWSPTWTACTWTGAPRSSGGWAR